jgi:uncharacterized protein (DUF1778 family)
MTAPLQVTNTGPIVSEASKPGVGGKTHRLQARLSAEQQRVLARAAAMEGRSLSEFVVVHAQEAAYRRIQEHNILELSERDSRAFVEALIAPWEPTPKMREDVRRMRTMFGED